MNYYGMHLKLSCISHRLNNNKFIIIKSMVSVILILAKRIDHTLHRLFFIGFGEWLALLDLKS